MERTADIVIIGGGIIGMSCAYELARQSDLHIAVFDKASIAGGTTGGSAGVICLHDMGALYAQLTLLGYARIQELRQSYEFGFQPWGALSVIYEPGEFPIPTSAYEQRFGGGSDSIYDRIDLDRDALLARFPWIRPERVRGGVLYPNQGFLDPYRLVALYERLALETGRVEIWKGTPVLQLRTTGDRIDSVVTRRGVWSAGTVLNAGGPWGAKIAALAGSELALTPQRIQVCVATGFDDKVDESPLTGVPESVDGEGVWCRGELGGTLLFGQHHHTTKPGYTVDPDYVNRINDESYPAAVEHVYRRYWHLPHSIFLNGWSCVYGTTADGFPILSRDQQITNFYHAVGMNGHGMTCHAGVALAMTELMLRNSATLDLTPLLGKPERLDFGALHAGRFRQASTLDFLLRD